jgi:hypothetical protein
MQNFNDMFKLRELYSNKVTILSVQLTTRDKCKDKRKFRVVWYRSVLPELTKLISSNNNHYPNNNSATLCCLELQRHRSSSVTRSTSACSPVPLPTPASSLPLPPVPLPMIRPCRRFCVAMGAHEEELWVQDNVRWIRDSERKELVKNG